MGRAQFPVTWLSQKTLSSLVFTFVMAGGVRGQPTANPKAFETDGTPNPPLCENIKDTLGKSIIVLKLARTRKSTYDIKQAVTS
jgi:hypothetical protein